MQLMNKVVLKAPATSANLGPGFDVFGLALEKPADIVTMEKSDKGVSIKITGVQAKTISTLPERNTAGVVADFMLKELKIKTGLKISIHKAIWPGKGLGSSAASAAAIAFGLNHLFNLKLSNQQLIRYAAKGETVSAGSEHADNVSATICGGFVILRSYEPLEIITFKAPLDMEIAVAFPHMATPPHKTERARSVLPKMVPLERVVKNIGNATAMVSGFASGDVELIGKSMTDVIVEPTRASLVPGYLNVRENALKAGASGVTISGAGPAMIAVVNGKSSNALKVAEAMKEGFESAGFEATSFVTRPGEGVSIIEE